MKRRLIIFLTSSLFLLSCSSDVPPRLGGPDYWRQYDAPTKNKRAELIARTVSSRFGKAYPLRDLTFRLSGREARNHSDVILEFISRTHRLQGVHLPSRAEFSFEVNAIPHPLKGVREAYNMHITARIVAIRPVAHGSQTIVKSSGNGQCSYTLRHYRRCDQLIGKILSNIVYEMR